MFNILINFQVEVFRCLNYERFLIILTLTQRDISRVNRRHLRLTTPRENHERYVPALARAHLAAESVISANKVSLGLGRVEEAGGVERREMPPSSNDLPFARNTHARARARHVRERVCVYRRVYVHNLAAVVSLEQGGIIRSTTINLNDDDDAAERAS